jgi:hypothetical protein
MEARCPENRRLAEDVVTAVSEVYTAKASEDQAKKSNEDLSPHALVMAWAQERRAVKALDAHKKEHGCK